MHLKRCRFPLSPALLLSPKSGSLKSFRLYLKRRTHLRNLLENILETFPAHPRKHRCQISGCQACGCQQLSFPPDHSQELCDRELKRFFFPSNPNIASTTYTTCAWSISSQCYLWISESYLREGRVESSLLGVLESTHRPLLVGGVQVCMVSIGYHHRADCSSVSHYSKYPRKQLKREGDYSDSWFPRSWLFLAAAGGGVLLFCFVS